MVGNNTEQVSHKLLPVHRFSGFVITLISIIIFLSINDLVLKIVLVLIGFLSPIIIFLVSINLCNVYFKNDKLYSEFVVGKKEIRSADIKSIKAKFSFFNQRVIEIKLKNNCQVVFLPCNGVYSIVGEHPTVTKLQNWVKSQSKNENSERLYNPKKDTMF